MSRKKRDEDDIREEALGALGISGVSVLWLIFCIANSDTGWLLVFWLLYPLALMAHAGMALGLPAPGRREPARLGAWHVYVPGRRLRRCLHDHGAGPDRPSKPALTSQPCPSSN
ncbi:hypothetical protein [Arenimonas fontis]|uniref:Uncharacterized protein n=1 Tax=Arenimonas fontis TaxID=2608255 RepID=A0A5B2ZAL3_9GAMM|nr:hypothetical protein [Arenimonas fontis]KAA2284350.1 hypothetical protein F0415_09800 [Arenimonas fontis]